MDGGGSDTTRVAIVSDRCKPKRCNQECKKSCPVVRTGKLCIEVKPTSKISFISEELCVGCGICVKKCPFDAISIINLPKNLESQTTHRFGPNTFKLHRLPQPRTGEVLGLVGTNGIGKSTALKILAGKWRPNLGRFDDEPTWGEIFTHFRGSELQNYFKALVQSELITSSKPQYVDQLAKKGKGKIQRFLTARDERGVMDQLIHDLDLGHVLDRELKELSGGELQRFAIAMASARDAQVYMFDEPSSYLDVKQRLKAALVIRGLLTSDNYVIVVEHDLSILDYLSDFVCVLYGQPGAYGVVTMPYSVRNGINVFLAGFIPTENMRFRDFELNFKLAEQAEEMDEEALAAAEDRALYQYPSMTKTLSSSDPGKADFVLHVEEGYFSDSEVIVMLGENGTGKSTFIRMLAGAKNAGPDEEDVEIPELHISYKPQKISPRFSGTVEMLLHGKIRSAWASPQFQTDVAKPLRLDELLDQEVKHLSGGELQRVAITLCLGMPADVYLIDEPSAYLDSEQRVVCAKIMKRFIMHNKKTAFVVEHDFLMATYMADRVIVMTGEPGVECTATSPKDLLTGMNQFLGMLNITFRRDPTNFRPRINKLNSRKDQDQKASGNYFFLESD